jgi:hypothetical protein
MNLDGHDLETLPATFDCDVIVGASTMAALDDTDGFICNAADQGRRKWLEVGARRVLFRAQGNTSDRFLEMGWGVVAVAGRPLMPDTKGKGRRRDHVPGFEPSWLIAIPPGR